MARAPYVSFPVRPSRKDQRPLAADVVAAVLRETREGRLPPGTRLPPVRMLERSLGLSKNTAQAAYDELVSRGVLEAREREGVFVASSTEGTPSSSARVEEPPLPRLRPAPPIGSTRIPRDGVSLSTVFIDPELLPRDKLADCARSVLRTPGIHAYYDAQGLPSLRELIAARLRKRGIDADASCLVITTGSQQAIDLVARAMEVRRVAIENPVYGHARMLFESVGLAPTPLRLDPFQGIDMELWEQRLAAARPGFVYAITSYQNPTGYSYSLAELTQLVSLARRYEFALVEDDWGSDMLSGGEYRPTLRALGGPNVVYVNSFTKKLLPSLRVGFVLAHPSLVPSLVAAKRLSTLGNAWLTEAIVSEFLDRGYYDAHLAQLQRELDARYARCLEALEELMPEGVRWTTPGGGPTLWLEVPRAVDLGELARACEAKGVHVENTSATFLGEEHLHGFRVSYAFSPPDVVRRGLTVVASELGRLLG